MADVGSQKVGFTPRARVTNRAAVRPPAPLPPPQVFEILDYTTASPWEAFAAQVEDVLRAWELRRGGAEWDDDQREVEWNEATYKLYLTVHDVDEDEMERGDGKEGAKSSADAPAHRFASSRPMRLWFDTDAYVQLRPSPARDIPLSLATTLLSALVVAADKARCSLPLFVPTKDSPREAVRGYALPFALAASPAAAVRPEDWSRPELALSFETDVRESVPDECNNLSGLLDLYSAKVAVGSTEGDARELSMTARFSYLHNGLDDGDWFVEQNVTGGQGEDGGCAGWGTGDSDPIQGIAVYALWPLFGEHAMTDNAVYSEFDMLKAPLWEISHTTGIVHCPLSEGLQGVHRILTLVRGVESVTDIVTTAQSGGSGGAEAAAGHMAWDVARSLTSAMSMETLPSAEKIDAILRITFDQESYQEAGDMRDPPRSVVKSAPLNSLTSTMALTCSRMGSTKGIFLLWSEYVRELRWHWDNAMPLPGLDASHPDTRHCLLHQKLQMLNVCIHRLRSAHPGDDDDVATAAAAPAAAPPAATVSSRLGIDSDDDGADSGAGWGDFDSGSDEDLVSDGGVRISFFAAGFFDFHAEKYFEIFRNISPILQFPRNSQFSQTNENSCENI